MRRNFIIALALAGITLAIYWPVRNYDLVYYDDFLFVTDNAEINSGLNWHSFTWAIFSVVAGNWHPVTNLSFVLNHQFWGANSGGEHLVNVVFHALNAGLLFLVLSRMTNSFWRSAVVAALFAWHPLRVESAAWIAERKDVLCGFFFLLTLLAWVRYAQGVTGDKRQVTGTATTDRAPLKSRVTRHASRFYWLALVFFVLGFMSKPIIVTLPFVLLLLDVWPLGRIADCGLRIADWKNPVQRSVLRWLFWEKWPFFGLTLVFCGLTYWIQKKGGAVVPWTRLGPEARLANAVTSYLQYLVKLVWPANLAVIYPYPKKFDDLETALTVLLLLAVTALCLCQLFRRPYLAVGWFWYLGTSVPIIGLVQIGEQAMADRYTYLPLIGPVISLVWLIAEWFPSGKMIPAAAATLVLGACVSLTGRQMQFWRNTIALFEHNVAVTPENASAHFTLGLGLAHAGDTKRAMVCYRVATMISPGDREAHRNLARLLHQQGHLTAARDEYNTLLALDPNDPAAHLSLADVAGRLGRTGEAVFQLNEALRLDPDSIEALNNLAWRLATCPDANIRNGTRAVQLAERACAITGSRQAIPLGTLATAYAEAGRFDDAIATAEKACTLASESGKPDLLKQIQELLELYRAHQPYHEAAEKLVPAAP
jgi:Tfp pilus assembly protein PilF